MYPSTKHTITFIIAVLIVSVVLLSSIGQTAAYRQVGIPIFEEDEGIYYTIN